MKTIDDETYYLQYADYVCLIRFYPDNTVVMVSTSGTAKLYTLTKESGFTSKGKYQIDKDGNIKFTAIGNVTIDYVGKIIDNDTIYLKGYNLTYKDTFEETYTKLYHNRPGDFGPLGKNRTYIESSFDDRTWTCDICGGDNESGCLYFDPTECPR
jgi:hypothetical protein